MLYGGIDRPHAHADYYKADCCHNIAFRGKKDQQDAEQFHGYPDTDQQLVAQSVGDEAGNQSPEHQPAKDQRAESRDCFIAQTGSGSGKKAWRPEEAGSFSGTVGKESDQRQQNTRHAKRLSDTGALAHLPFIRRVVLLPQRQGEDHDQQNARLNESRPAVALVPSGQSQCQCHDGRTDDGSHSIEAVQEIHY